MIYLSICICHRQVTLNRILKQWINLSILPAECLENILLKFNPTKISCYTVTTVYVYVVYVVLCMWYLQSTRMESDLWYGASSKVWTMYMCVVYVLHCVYICSIIQTQSQNTDIEKAVQMLTQKCVLYSARCWQAKLINGIAIYLRPGRR